MKIQIGEDKELYHRANLSPISSSFGARLKAAREYRNLSNADLSRALGCDHSVIGKYESGSRNPDLSTLFKLSEILDINPMWLKYGISNISYDIKDGVYSETFYKNLYNTLICSKKEEYNSESKKVDAYILDYITKYINKAIKNNDKESLSALYQFTRMLEIRNSKAFKSIMQSIKRNNENKK